MKSLHFKVEQEDWSAELQLPANSTLEDLAAAILAAAKFEMDHAYGFHDNLKNPYRSTEEYTLFVDMGEERHVETDTGVQTTRIDSVFKAKKKMLFHFDYGDDWFFLLTCTGEEEGKAFKKPKTLKTTGAPPEQYPDWDEEE